MKSNPSAGTVRIRFIGYNLSPAKGTPFHSRAKVKHFFCGEVLTNVKICFIFVITLYQKRFFMDLSNKYVITINRELGTGGRSVAKLLAQKLGVPFYDRAHLQSLEDKEGVNEEKIESLKSKKRTWWPDLKRMVELDGGFAVSIYDNLPNFAVPEKNDTDEKFKTEQEILKGIADAESCVVVGRCSFVTFKDHPNHLHIWIQSPMECRVERVMKKKGIASKAEAEKFIKEVDELCDEYSKRHTGVSRYDPRNYDLVISMKDRTEEEAVDLILKYIG